MFSGIVEEAAVVKSLRRKSDCYELEVKSRLIYQKADCGESISVDGVCLTLKKKAKEALLFDVMEATYKNTKFKYSRVNERVNLERALKLESLLSGHLVSGHVDTVLEVYKIEKKRESSKVFIKIPSQYLTFVVNKGSIALNGVSLTIQEVKNDMIAIGLIPYTLLETNLKDLKIHSKVNVEFDLLGKYVCNYLKNVRC